MDFKKLLIVLIVSSLLIGTVCAANLTDFKIDGKFKEVIKNDDFVIYANDNTDAGIGVFKNVDKVGDDDANDGTLIDKLVHDDGKEYLVADDDMKLALNPDHTANFTDMDHGTVGLSEVVDHGGDKLVIVFWATNSSNLNMDSLKTTLDQFNKDNSVSPVPF